MATTVVFFQYCIDINFAAKRFFPKALKACHNQESRVVTIDKNAAYPKAIDEFKAEK